MVRNDRTNPFHSENDDRSELELQQYEPSLRLNDDLNFCEPKDELSFEDKESLMKKTKPSDNFTTPNKRSKLKSEEENKDEEFITE